LTFKYNGNMNNANTAKNIFSKEKAVLNPAEY